MGLVAINNYLNNNVLVERFRAEPAVRSIELLLQERIPLEASLSRTSQAETNPERVARDQAPPVVRTYRTPDTAVPAAHLLSNGYYSVMVTNSGAGYSRAGKLAVTRWREDAVRDPWGTFIYISDPRHETLWSATAAPLGHGRPRNYQASFSLDKAEFHRRDGDIETHTEIVVSPEDNAEVRQITLTNRGIARYELDLTSYAEVVLATPAADDAHPAFSKLFVETEYLPEFGALLATRRPRSASEDRTWLVHVVAVENPGQAGGPFGPSLPEDYQTDRLAFLGRGGSPASPKAIQVPSPEYRVPSDVGELDSGSQVGAVLDPIISLRQRVRIGPGARTRLSFITAVAGSREEALTLVDKYHDPAWTERAFRMALTHSRLELRQLDLSSNEALQYQRLFSRMIYPRPGTSPTAEMMARNVKGQPALWAYGITGDLPVLLVRIADPRESRIVRQALRAHQYWQSRGFQADLVVLNEYPGGYVQPVQEELEKLVSASHAHQLLNKPGGVYVKRADIMPDADRILLNTVARVVLIGSRGTLAAQLDIDSGPGDGRRTTGDERSRPALRYPYYNGRPSVDNRWPLMLGNGLGGFSPDGREYVITLQPGRSTPLPWSNTIANPHFGCMVSESSLGSTWSENSRENRLSPWSNDPVSDPPSEVIYIRDEENGEFWTSTPLPVREDDPYTIRHGQGYTIYEHESHGIAQSLRVSVASEDPVKICTLSMRNKSPQTRKFTVTYYVEWVLGVSRGASGRYVITEADSDAATILARNPYNNEFAGRVAFASAGAEAGKVTMTASRAEFIGRNGSLSEPAFLRARTEGRGLRAERTSLGASPASTQSSVPSLPHSSFGAGLDPCAVLKCAVLLEPGQEKSVHFVLGEGAGTEEARRLAERYRDPQQAEEAHRGALAMWDRLLTTVEVHTPDPAMDLMLNRWLLYQSVSCRFWARSAFYQGGGAYGFRDQLQDVMALVYAAPELAREHILRSAARQFLEGDVQHWWHPPTGRGVRTRFSDDLLWLPYVTAHYVAATGDTAILDESLHFLQAPILEPGQEDMYGTPVVTEEQAPLYEHCLRAIARGTTAGAHGLPLMGAGDWNDGMNRVGIEGKGESVWVGWFLYATLKAFLPVCNLRKDKQQYAGFRAEMNRLKKALEGAAWDGKWYLRAFYDDGTPMGSHSAEECRIDSIAQSWAVISGAGGEVRSRQAMASVQEYLVRPEDDMILLFTPPFDKTPHDPGYVKGYLPGVRENGGQYTHAAIWTALANVLLGNADDAYRLFNMLNPINHARTPAEVARYMVEPYVVAADIYSHPQHTGRGGWTWYTGSASWLYRLGVEYMLGVKLHGNYLTIQPCIPSHWPGYSITYRRGSSTYHITVENSAAGTEHRVSNGAGERDARVSVLGTYLDGVAVSDAKIPLRDDGRQHEVRVVLGAPDLVLSGEC
jgi:cyclic beta-1,2-glucan synthetase